MRPVSAAFLRAIRGSHTMVSDARIVTGFPTGVNPTGTAVPIIGGDVQVNAKADIHSSLSLEVSWPWPTTATDLMAPFGSELFIRRGIRFGNGTTEMVSLGYHRIDTLEQDSPPDGPLRVTGKDRMAGIVDARLLAPVQFAVGTAVGAAVTALVQGVYPTATIEWDDATDAATLTRAQVAEEDRYGFLNDLVTSYGKIWYWDYRGILVIKDPPDPSVPVFAVDHGANGVLVSMGRSLTRERVYNAVVATGEAGDTDAPARGVAYDNSVTSPTYFAGPFGPVPRFYSSPFITTDAQAQSAAAAMLTQALGLPYMVDFSMVPNPALEPWDPVEVKYPDRARSSSSTVELHVIESLTVPLVASDPMPATTREKTLTLIGTA